MSLERCTDKDCRRICVLYKGELDIKAEAEKLGIKVNKFAVGSKKGNGYTILCVNDATKADELKNLEGILRVRVI